MVKNLFRRGRLACPSGEQAHPYYEFSVISVVNGYKFFKAEIASRNGQ
jgi:hypothetical protein